MQLHNFIICSLMSLGFSNISIRSQQTGPHSLQQTHTYRYTNNNFIFYLSLPQHASYMWLSLFKRVTAPCQTTEQNFTCLLFIAAVMNGGQTSLQLVHKPCTSIHNTFFFNFMLICPCIVKLFLKIFQQDDTFFLYSILFPVNGFTCFGWNTHPSSGAWINCNYSIW
jgi:hypothetical protein